MADLVERYLNAARVPDSMPIGAHGAWLIQRAQVPAERAWGWPTATLLRRLVPTVRTEDNPFAGEADCDCHLETVMEDGRRELARHLPIWLAARGRVLITGLGLGCVVRGLLANELVEHIDVVEIDRDIIAAVWPEFDKDPRCSIYFSDALTFEPPEDARWDFAWHDIWANRAAGQPHLQVLHGQLFGRFKDHAAVQGAWMFPRELKNRIGALGGTPRKVRVREVANG